MRTLLQVPVSNLPYVLHSSLRLVPADLPFLLACRLSVRFVFALLAFLESVLSGAWAALAGDHDVISVLVWPVFWGCMLPCLSMCTPVGPVQHRYRACPCARTGTFTWPQVLLEHMSTAVDLLRCHALRADRPETAAGQQREREREPLLLFRRLLHLR